MGLVSVDYGTGARAIAVAAKAGRALYLRTRYRAASAVLGLTFFVGVLDLEACLARRLFAVAAVAFLWASVAGEPARQAERDDAELLALIHNRLATVDEHVDERIDAQVCRRLDAILAELRQD